MEEFTATELGSKTGDVLLAAARSPVSIARHGKSRFVVLDRAEYDAMRKAADSRIARRTADIPDQEGMALAAELTRIIEADD